MKPLGAGSRHDQSAKSNPSKRHRERLNSELEHLASLLPFEQNVIVKLDKLSILRLAVSYLRMKCYFQAFTYDRLATENRLVSHLYHCPFDLTRIEGEACLQADILHQSVLELIHSEDREEFRRQLSWRSCLPPELQSCALSDLMTREFSQHLRRRFTVRFRCLLDNTSGFITLELSGRLQFLYGQTREKHSTGSQPHHKSSVSTRTNQPNNSSSTCSSSGSSTNPLGVNQFNLPPLGLFVVCSPLGPLPSLNGSQRDLTFKTKHQLDLTVMTIDSRQHEGMELLNRRSDEYKLPFPLLEPETLLSEDGIGGNGRLVSEFNGGFSVAQLKEFETNFLDSIVNGNGKCQTGKVEQPSIQMHEAQTVQDVVGSSTFEHELPVGRGLKKEMYQSSGVHSSVNQRASGTSRENHLFARGSSLHNSCSRQPNSPQSSNSRMRPSYGKSGQSKRKKNLPKDSGIPSAELHNYVYPHLQGPFGLPQTIGLRASENTHHPYGDSYSRPDLCNLESHFQSFSAGRPFTLPHSDVVAPNISDFDYTSNYYLGWRTTDNYPTPQFTQFTSNDQSIPNAFTKNNSTDNPSLNLREPLSYPNIESYSQYPTPYDAYAMAAVAVVAAASGYQQPQPQQQHFNPHLQQQPQSTIHSCQQQSPSEYSPSHIHPSNTPSSPHRFPVESETGFHRQFLGSSPSITLRSSVDHLTEDIFDKQNVYPRTETNQNFSKTATHRFTKDFITAKLSNGVPDHEYNEISKSASGFHQIFNATLFDELRHKSCNLYDSGNVTTAFGDEYGRANHNTNLMNERTESATFLRRASGASLSDIPSHPISGTVHTQINRTFKQSFAEGFKSENSRLDGHKMADCLGEHFKPTRESFQMPRWHDQLKRSAPDAYLAKCCTETDEHTGSADGKHQSENKSTSSPCSSNSSRVQSPETGNIRESFPGLENYQSKASASFRAGSSNKTHDWLAIQNEEVGTNTAVFTYGTQQQDRSNTAVLPPDYHFSGTVGPLT
ncbi:aryl hydrocarbon receptor [Paragonimus westermani]|uniref:Aryl hydrocarbon receptor n=1 Tax=Paragonimus westermani TaxID=34504 RepID=A0A5J4NYJ9_9TREM|nr:aryl hydrocarbon receptor [Paragonimus westermani]